jgi:hypothetical protein
MGAVRLRALVALTVLGVVASCVVATAASTASASVSSAAISGRPASNTPYITSANGYVRLIRQCGRGMYAVGTFSTVGRPGQPSVTRNNAFGFIRSTGAITSWNPNVNGEVDTITFSADCRWAYLGGLFTQVGSTAVKNLAKVALTSTAQVDGTFGHNADGRVATLQRVGSHLLIGGFFTAVNDGAAPHIRSLSLVTGKDDGWVRLGVGGSYGTGFPTHVFKFALSHHATKLLVMGVFTRFGGQDRRQVLMLDLGLRSVTVDPWYSTLFNGVCSADSRFFVKAATWSPDDARVYVGTTGRSGATLCDAAAAFRSGPSSTQGALWVNKTGCDSLYSVAATSAAVFVGGHERWANNPKGCDAPGPGAVSRQGIGAIGTITGLAASWNPTRARGIGADDMYIDPDGNLWVASDNGPSNEFTQCGRQFHPGICMFPHV